MSSQYISFSLRVVFSSRCFAWTLSNSFCRESHFCSCSRNFSAYSACSSSSHFRSFSFSSFKSLSLVPSSSSIARSASNSLALFTTQLLISAISFCITSIARFVMFSKPGIDCSTSERRFNSTDLSSSLSSSLTTRAADSLSPSCCSSSSLAFKRFSHASSSACRVSRLCSMSVLA